MYQTLVLWTGELQCALWWKNYVTTTHLVEGIVSLFLFKCLVAVINVNANLQLSHISQ